MKPLCIDIFCGLGGWSEGFLESGYDCVGFDIERHDYGTGSYPGQLVIQDALTLHGSQFRNAACIVASPPCQRYSYMAMPWSRAKKMAVQYRQYEADLNDLFNACFRIQREACEAAGRYIPMVVENVRGAQPWVGPAVYNYGSFYFWGDVPPLMPTYRTEGIKVPSFRFDGSGKSFQTEAVNVSRRTAVGNSVRFTSRDCGIEGIKQGGNWWHDPKSMTRKYSSGSTARKAASASIAKIPLPVSRWIAQCFMPKSQSVLKPSAPDL
jgi:hypothetical protein